MEKILDMLLKLQEEVNDDELCEKIAEVYQAVGELSVAQAEQSEKPNKQAPKLSYNNDPDSGLIEIFVNHEEFTTWSYEDDPQDSFNEFKRVFEAGYKAGLAS